MKKQILIGSIIVAAAGIVTVGGLAASGEGFANPEAAPLPDGIEVVTQQVYDAAYATFDTCMTEGGAPLLAQRDFGGVHQFSYATEDAAVYDTCYAAFAPIDFKWQVSQSYNSETFLKLRQCLTNMDIEPGADTDTVLAQVKDSGMDVPMCFSEVTLSE